MLAAGRLHSTQQISLYCVLSRVFLQLYEAAEGIDWVWEHRIDDLMKLGL